MSVQQVIAGTDPRQHHHPTAKLGFRVHDALDAALQLATPESGGGPSVCHIPGDGNCATEAARRAYEQITRAAGAPAPVYDASSSDAQAVRRLKSRCGEQLLDFVVPRWRGADAVTDHVDESARLKLDSLGLWAEELAQDAVTHCGARRVTQDGVSGSGLPIRWLRQAVWRLADANGRHLRIPELALMAATLGCNIVVWEFDGECLIPYRNEFTSGLFLVSPDAAYIHLVHNTFTEWFESYPGQIPQRWKTRTPGLENSVAKHNHFEYVCRDTSSGSPSTVLSIVASIEAKINLQMRAFPAEILAAAQTAPKLTPAPVLVPKCDGAGEEGAAAEAGARGDAGSNAKSRCKFEGVGRATGASCANRARLASSLCERDPLPTVALECTGGDGEGGGPNGWPDLAERGAALTKTVHMIPYNEGYGASENEQLLYEKWLKVAWREGHALGKTLMKKNATKDSKERDPLRSRERLGAGSSEERDFIAGGLNDGREGMDLARKRSSTSFPDRPTKEKEKRARRPGYGQEDEDESETEGGGEEEIKGSEKGSTESGGGGGSLKGSAGFSIEDLVSGKLPRLCLDDLPLLQKDQRGKLAKIFVDLALVKRKLPEALTNAWLLYKAWLEALDYDKVGISFPDFETEREAQGGAGDAVGSSACEAVIRDRYKTAVTELRLVTRTQWLEDLSQHITPFSYQERAARKPEASKSRRGAPSDCEMLRAYQLP